MIALALLPQPQLVIADEPTTALDVTIQVQILKLLKQLAKKSGVSVLFTTHDLGTAYEICDRITVMYAGQEVETAPVDDFFRRPHHPYTVRLLESLPPPGRELREIGGEIPGLITPPAGCRFHPRCARATDICRVERPARRAARRRARGALLPPHRRGDPGMSDAPILQVDTLSRHFPVRNMFGRKTGAVRALDGVSFEVRSGETLGIVGESGCGKSTLGKALVGIHPPGGGRIVFEGKEITGQSASERRAVAPDCSIATRTRAIRSTRAGRSAAPWRSRSSFTPR